MKSVIIHSAAEIIETVDGAVDKLEKHISAVIKPVRKSAFERFPIIFTLLVTFGLVATLRGFDLLLSSLPTLYNSPELLLSIGIGILVITGTMYKKLG